MLTFPAEILRHALMSEYSYVDRPDTITADLHSHATIGVDTEFMREKTFFAQLCLVQLAVDDRFICVDPLSGRDMQTFWSELCAKTWVVHSARQDIEVIYQSADLMPTALFDTQVAAGLLGLQPQLGYAGLVSELFGVDLPKTHTRADWSKRPIADALLQYAAEDVEYLLPARDELASRLDAKGRLAWAQEDSAMLLDRSLYTVDASQAVARLKGATNLRGRPRAAAERLAAWRETEALKRNRPRQWILRDKALLELATKLPDTMRALRGLSEMPPGLLDRAGSRLLEEIGASAGDRHGYEPPDSPNESQKKLLKSLQRVTAECAQDLGISAELVAPRKELTAAVLSGERDSRVFSGWRREVVGERLLALI